MNSCVSRLASVSELKSSQFISYMESVNTFARPLGLTEMTSFSKVWEYPWLWFNGLSQVDWRGKHVIDLGSELSPMPWLFASLGASVTLVETHENLAGHWAWIRDKMKVSVNWKSATSEIIPIESGSTDIVTSFSVVEHQPDKAKAINEVVRILKNTGIFALSFDVCEPAYGMTFPEWNGRALNLREFEQEVWFHPAFRNTEKPIWNLQDIEGFKEWHLKSAPHHNYVVGAAFLKK